LQHSRRVAGVSRAPEQARAGSGIQGAEVAIEIANAHSTLRHAVARRRCGLDELFSLPQVLGHSLWTFHQQYAEDDCGLRVSARHCRLKQIMRKSELIGADLPQYCECAEEKNVRIER
jgi:hypothetical protein